MNKQTWKSQCRKTAYASGKKRLNKKERGEIMTNMIKLNLLNKKENKENWNPKYNKIQTIGEILKTRRLNGT